MDKRNLKALILVGLFVLAFCVGIIATTWSIVDDMLDAAANVVVMPQQDDIPADDTVQAMTPTNTEPTASAGDSSVETEPSDVVLSEPIETTPQATVFDEAALTVTESVDLDPDNDVVKEIAPTETEPISDGTGDGDPSDTETIGADMESSEFDDEKSDDSKDSEYSEDSELELWVDIDQNASNAVPTVEYIEYKIQYGDTLGEIAAAHGTTVAELARINDIENVNLIYTGALILIPVETIVCENGI